MSDYCTQKYDNLSSIHFFFFNISYKSIGFLSKVTLARALPITLII